MANYKSALNGEQMDAALMDVALHNSEAWAVGTRNTIPVSSSDETYQNNSKYYAQVAKSAIPGTYTAAVRWDIAQGLAGESQEQARANISAGASNRNLLDNPFFTVNQRNFTSSTGVNNIYSVDRWYIARGTGTISKTNNGITINGVGASRETTFQQMIDCGDLTGRTVALSVNDGGTIRQITGIVPTRTTSNNIFIRFTLRDGVSAFLYAMATSSAYAYMLQFQVNEGYTLNLLAAKVELGSYSTLANDAPPDYGEELRKCQRYFVRLVQAAPTLLGSGFCTSGGGGFVALIPTPVPMRTVASVVGQGQFSLAHGTTRTNFTTVSVSHTQQNGVAVSGSGTVTANAPCFLFCNNTGYVDINADL